ncbi:MAG: VWA domain-containing protein [Terriglobales bacterium]
MFGAVASLAAFAQEAAPTFKVDVKVVNVLATVRDKNGQIVKDLNKDDFILEEDGRPQTIKYFAKETELPLTLGLLVDTSGSQRKTLNEERTGSLAFVNEVLRPGKDSAFLIHFDHEVELLQDVTTSPEKLDSRLQELQEERDGNYGGGGGGRSGRGGGGFGAGTLLYDSVFLASDEVLQKQEGRKAIVLLTDGVDHGSKMSLDDAIESAQRANTIVYSIYYAGEEGGDRRFGASGPWGGGGGGRRGGGWPGGGGGWPGGGGGYPGGSGRRGGGRGQGENSVDGKKVLERLSRETGGHMFVVSKKDSIDKIYAQIQDELRNEYNLGYTPDQGGDAGADYRHITVSTRQKDLKVQARQGYYPARQVANAGK